MSSCHLIETDTYDRDAFERVFKHVGDREALLETGEKLLPHFRELLEDLFALVFKLCVRLRPATATPVATLLNRKILLGTMASEGFGELKEETALDAARAVHAACELARRAVALVKAGDLLLEDELLAGQDLAQEEERLERNRRALQELGSASKTLTESLKRAVEQGEAKVQGLAEQMKRSVSEMPPRFEAQLASVAGRLADELPRLDASADSFARAVGASGPRTPGERLRLAEKLEKSEKLRTLARLAGAFRAEARAARRRHRERAATEVYRVGRGNEIGRLLPSELCALRHPLRRRDFMRRFLEGEIVQYDLRGDDRHGRGPIVVCIDGSGSMSGGRELWAKAVGLALLDIARRQGRRARAVVFSGPETPLSEFDLTGKGRSTGRRPVDLEAVVGLAECFPGGGTDFEKPLRAALETVRSAGFKGADIIFITDGEAQVTDAFAEEFRDERKRRDIELFAVLVDDPKSRNRVNEKTALDRAAKELGKVADRLTTVTELTADSARDLFKDL